MKLVKRSGSDFWYVRLPGRKKILLHETQSIQMLGEDSTEGSVRILS